MRKITITSLDNLNESYDLQCGELKCVIDTTSFTHTSNFYSLPVDDFAFILPDDTFEPQEITFQAIYRQSEAPNMKRFIRGNKIFILTISSNNNTQDEKKVIVRKNSESIQQVASTDLDVIDFSFITLSHFIKVKTQTFNLNDYILTATGQYATSTTDTDPNMATDGYIYGTDFNYGTSTPTLEDFVFDLLPNEGDKKMYMKWELENFEDDPTIGIGARAVNTQKAYVADGITQSNSVSHNLVINSYPLFKKIELQPKILMAVVENVEQLRDFQKDSYLTIDYLENNPRAFLSNIYKGKIEYYEQYENL